MEVCWWLEGKMDTQTWSIRNRSSEWEIARIAIQRWRWWRASRIATRQRRPDSTIRIPETIESTMPNAMVTYASTSAIPGDISPNFRRDMHSACKREIPTFQSSSCGDMFQSSTPWPIPTWPSLENNSASWWIWDELGFLKRWLPEWLWERWDRWWESHLRHRRIGSTGIGRKNQEEDRWWDRGANAH